MQGRSESEIYRPHPVVYSAVMASVLAVITYLDGIHSRQSPVIPPRTPIIAPTPEKTAQVYGKRLDIHPRLLPTSAVVFKK